MKFNNLKKTIDVPCRSFDAEKNGLRVAIQAIIDAPESHEVYVLAGGRSVSTSLQELHDHLAKLVMAKTSHETHI